MDSVSVRIQDLAMIDQVIVLARLAEGRSETGGFNGTGLRDLFDEFALPKPAKITNQLAELKRRRLLTQVKADLPWRLTPRGRAYAGELTSDMDLAALAAEAGRHPLATLAGTPHPLIPPSLAPPELIDPLRGFFEEFPFERNTFLMTRFPGEDEASSKLDEAIGEIRDACERHGLVAHLASDHELHPDLGTNVIGHLWASRYGIAIFEEREGGLNYNLNIEAGSCLALGRPLAILRDRTVGKLPTDLVGRIYHPVDLDDPGTVGDEIHRWIREALMLGECDRCPE